MLRTILHTTASRRWIVLALAGLMASSAWARPPVEVVALFKNSIVIRGSSGQEMLRTGQTSSDGVTLIKADTRGATVSYRDQQFELGLSDRIAGSFTRATENTVRINRDQWGQYYIPGTVNEHPTNFLVDTGASLVVMSEHKAQAIGLDYRSGEMTIMQTAQGTAISYLVPLAKVTIGGITVHNVRGAVVEGAYPQDVLLGMSFLSSVSLAESDGVLSLTAKF